MAPRRARLRCPRRASHPHWVGNCVHQLWITCRKPVRNQLFRRAGAHPPRGAMRSEHFASRAAARARARNRPFAASARPCHQARRPEARRWRRDSDLGEALAALGAARGDDCTATTGLHADEKTVCAGTAGLGRLVGALHGSSSGSVGVRSGCSSGRPLSRRPSEKDLANGPGISLCIGQRNVHAQRLLLRCTVLQGAAPKALASGLPRSLSRLGVCAPDEAQRMLLLGNQGNPRLEQKHPYRSNTCTTSCGLARGLTGVDELWITADSRAEGAYNPAAHRRTCPQ